MLDEGLVQQRVHLPVQNDLPDEVEGALAVAVDNVVRRELVDADLAQRDAVARERLEHRLDVVQALRPVHRRVAQVLRRVDGDAAKRSR